MKLELKHLAPYLPYGLQMHNIHNGNTFELKGIYDEGDFSIRNLIYVFKGERSHFDLLKVNFKPLLIPLSELPENGLYADKVKYGSVSYAFMVFCFQNHFDVFGLIPAGLALKKLEVLAPADK